MNCAARPKAFPAARTAYLFWAMLALVLLTARAEGAGSTNMVIAEIYGGGGDTGAAFQNDFVVLFNRGNTPANITGWSLQYQSQGTTNWTPITLAPALVSPGGYYLVQLGSGGAAGDILPPFDTSFPLNISPTSGKFALVNNPGTLSNSCPLDIRIIDRVGYGSTTVVCNETANAPTPSNTNSIQRKFSGCKDTDNNANDFVLDWPNPRNSSTPLHGCPPGNPPDLLVQSSDQYVCIGGDAVFFAQIDGDVPMNFYWFSNDVLIVDGVISTDTNSTLSLTNLPLAADGSYFYVLITNPYGTTNSSTNFLYVGVVPQVVQQASDQVVPLGGIIQFSVQAAPTPLQYHWAFEGRILTNDARISGSDGPNLWITNAQFSDAGYYRPIVSNSCLALGFSPVRCDVQSPPIITNQPISQVAPFNTSVQFSVGVANPPPLTYQWYRDDLPLPGQINSTLNLSGVQRPQVGIYHVVVKSPGGAVTSDRAHLQVELTLEGNLIPRQEATDIIDGLTNAVRPLIFQPTLIFHGVPLLFSTIDATVESWETTRCGVPPTHSMWLLYYSPRSEITKISTEGSDFDTVLAVYTWNGNPNVPPALVDCNDNGAPDGRSSLLNIPLVANTDYYIAVDGVRGATGKARVQVGEVLRKPRFDAAAGAFRCELAGPMGYWVKLQSRTDLQSPGGWQTVVTIPPTTADWVVGYTNFLAGSDSQRFYRTGVNTNSNF